MNDPLELIHPRRIHPRYNRPLDGVVLETSDGVVFRYSLASLAELSPFFQALNELPQPLLTLNADGTSNHPAPNVIPLPSISSGPLAFTLDAARNLTSGGQVPLIMPHMVWYPWFLEQLVELALSFELRHGLYCLWQKLCIQQGAGRNPALGYTIACLLFGHDHEWGMAYWTNELEKSLPISEWCTTILSIHQPRALDALHEFTILKAQALQAKLTAYKRLQEEKEEKARDAAKQAQWWTDVYTDALMEAEWAEAQRASEWADEWSYL